LTFIAELYILFIRKVIPMRKIIGSVRKEHPPQFFVNNGVPDGYVIRLANLEERHFPTATKIDVGPDGGIEVRFDMIWLASFAKGEFLEYWRVWRPRRRS
jgi:hypothetical protein